MEDAATLGEFARKLRVYFRTASMGISFLIYGAIFGGYWLLIFSIGSLYNSPWIFIGGTLGVIPLVFLCALLVAKTVPGIRRERLPYEGARWMVSLIIPIAAAIIIGSLYSIPSLWYGTLGASFLLVHFLIERPLVLNGLIKAKPFLLASILMLLSFPALLSLPPYLDSMAALGLCLLFYSLAGVYALVRAAKLFSE
jgi:glycopeptide antibiotics resistance protein